MKKFGTSNQGLLSWLLSLLALATAAIANKQCKSSIDFQLHSKGSLVRPGGMFYMTLQLPKKSICHKRALCRLEITVPDGAILISQDLGNITTSVDPDFSSLIGFTLSPTKNKHKFTFRADACAPLYNLNFEVKLMAISRRHMKKVQECTKPKQVRMAFD